MWDLSIQQPHAPDYTSKFKEVKFKRLNFHNEKQNMKITQAMVPHKKGLGLSQKLAQRRVL